MEIKAAIARSVEGCDLAEGDACAVMEQIMSGRTTPAQISALLIALRLKGETVEEVTGFARAMRRNVTPIDCRHPLLVDTCGTGGDGCGTFNISTTAAFVIAGAGIAGPGDTGPGLAVAKHGNRSVSSRCGSADVLQALGVSLELAPREVATCIDEVGIGFLYAPTLHPAMKHAIGPRCEIGVRTVFNILGPLTNPAGAQVQVLGVYDADLTEMLARVLRALGCRAAFVVHGPDGLDELSPTGLNRITQLRNGQVHTFTLDPLELGLPRARLADLKGGDAGENATILRAVLAGEAGPRRDAVLLNAASALVAAEAAADLGEGLSLAAQSIDSGAAQTKLASLIVFTNEKSGPAQ